jgi:2-amino-4-hydroxy-6-hydroxymethyldihydropteridine diphosphokinase
MILIGLGGNLPSPEYEPPAATLAAALGCFAEAGIDVLRLSPWFRSAPVPASDQPWFVNVVAVVAFSGAPQELLNRLHAFEDRFGRVRLQRWEARAIDLDLLAFNNLTVGWRGAVPEDSTQVLVIPHPRLHERLFVLAPLAELAPEWRHPVFGSTAAEMIARLPVGQQVERFEPAIGI